MSSIEIKTNLDSGQIESFTANFISAFSQGIYSAGDLIASEEPNAVVNTVMKGNEGIITVHLKPPVERREATISEYQCTIHLYKGGTITVNIPQPPVSYIQEKIWNQVNAVIIRTVLESIRRMYI